MLIHSLRLGLSQLAQRVAVVAAVGVWIATLAFAVAAGNPRRPAQFLVAFALLNIGRGGFPVSLLRRHGLGSRLTESRRSRRSRSA